MAKMPPRLGVYPQKSPNPPDLIRKKKVLAKMPEIGKSKVILSLAVSWVSPSPSLKFLNFFRFLNNLEKIRGPVNRFNIHSVVIIYCYRINTF